MKNLALIMSALTLGVLGCSNPYERDNPTDPIFVYTVTFNASDATGGTPPAALSGNYGDVVTLPDGGGLVKSGYVVTGWANREGKTCGLPSELGSNIPFFWASGSSYTIKCNITLNAEWLPAYTVTFDGNGATSGTAPPAMTVRSGRSIEIPDNGLQRTGYVFDGWAANSSGTGTNYEVGSSYMPTGNITLYAKWSALYTITFDGNGATGGTAPTAITAASSFIQLPAKGNLEKTGYVFGGWNTNNSGTGTKYGLGSFYALTGNITLYAEWISCNPETHFCDMRDDQVYRITTIGEQIWFAENLNYSATGSKCHGNVNSNCDKYGKLYNWATAMALPSTCNSSTCSSQIQSPHQGICPEGWHLPTQAEWNVLGNDARKLKATTGWNSDGNGTDDYGFSALPGGYGNSDGSFNGINYNGYWWSANESGSNANAAYSLYMTYNYEDARWNNDYKSSLSYVRCVKD